jgi:hypothetical protein
MHEAAVARAESGSATNPIVKESDIGLNFKEISLCD